MAIVEKLRLFRSAENDAARERYKPALLLSINCVAAGYFILWGSVHWADAIVMAVGAISGGFGGAGLARRLGRQLVRRTVVVIGLIMAVSLLYRH